MATSIIALFVETLALSCSIANLLLNIDAKIKDAWKYMDT